MDSRPRFSRRLTLLDLPNELLLKIFDHFGSTSYAGPLRQERGWRYPRDFQASDLPTLQKSRLVCRRLDALVSPLLCPVPRVSVSGSSVNRLEMLTRNSLIAQGVCGLDVDLRYRPTVLAQDLRRYFTHVCKILDDASRGIDWCTEFSSYAADDESEEAIEYRAMLEADTRLWLIRRCWTEHVESREHAQEEASFAEQEVQPGDEESTVVQEEDQLDPEDDHSYQEDEDEDETQNGPTVNIDTEAYQNLLQASFDTYAKLQSEQTRIISDGSFVQSLTTVLSRCKYRPFLWFGDDDPDQYGCRTKAVELANDLGSLSLAMGSVKGWLDTEGLAKEEVVEKSLILPARVLVELPIACHEAGVTLRGLSIGCFPLTKGFRSVLPTGHTDTTWTGLATACQEFEILHFGSRGMNCTPHRLGRIGSPDCAIVDAYLGAVCSSPRLESLCIGMTPFRVHDSSFRNRDDRTPNPDLYHRAGTILKSIKSTTLREFHLMSLEMDGADLESVVQCISDTALRAIFFSGITLDQGSYAEAMNILRNKVSTQRSKPTIHFSTLQGAEFGAPKKFKDSNSWMFGSSEDRKSYWDKLLEYQHPASLQLVEKWVMDAHEGDQSPFLR